MESNTDGAELGLGKTRPASVQPQFWQVVAQAVLLPALYFVTFYTKSVSQGHGTNVQGGSFKLGWVSDDVVIPLVSPPSSNVSTPSDRKNSTNVSTPSDRKNSTASQDDKGPTSENVLGPADLETAWEMVEKECPVQIDDADLVVSDPGALEQVEQACQLEKTDEWEVKPPCFTKVGCELFANALRLAPGLNKLEMINFRTMIDATCAKMLVKALPLGLQTLDLRSNEIGNEGAIALAGAWRRFPKMRVLHLNDNKIGPRGAKCIALILSTDGILQELRLGKNDVEDSAAEVFADALKKNRELKVLGLAESGITEKGARSFGNALRENQHLEQLFLEKNPISANGVLALAQAWPTNKKLAYLLLDDTCADGHGQAKYPWLERLLTNQKWKQLGLSNTNIDNNGAILLADALKKNENFVALRLAGNMIGHDGALALAEALKQISEHKLQYLDLEGNKNIGFEDQQKLKHAAWDGLHLVF